VRYLLGGFHFSCVLTSSFAEAIHQTDAEIAFLQEQKKLMERELDVSCPGGKEESLVVGMR
jgi:hypothetical protein